jgi:hypothetical protein
MNDNTNTALILRPADAPRIRVLECDGPAAIRHVHAWPGAYSPQVLSFEEFIALPEHVKTPRLATSDWNQASRCARLLRHAQDTGHLPARHLREILIRLETLHGPLES